MSSIVTLVFLICLVDQDVPFKASEEFELKTEYDFRVRTSSNEEIDFSGRAKPSASPRPYMEVTLKILKLNPSETRIKIVSDQEPNLRSKKVSAGDVFRIDMGFTDDMKDRTKAHLYTVQFLTEDKKSVVSQIVIDVDEEGNFYVNRELRGKL